LRRPACPAIPETYRRTAGRDRRANFSGKLAATGGHRTATGAKIPPASEPQNPLIFHRQANREPRPAGTDPATGWP